jgi:hypothetical protein
MKSLMPEVVIAAILLLHEQDVEKIAPQTVPRTSAYQGV